MVKKNSYNSKKKYIKKNKKSVKIGGSKKINIDFGIVTYQTLGDCVKELVESSFDIYNYILNYFFYPVTIICGGQSPSYYCLSMMNSKLYICHVQKMEVHTSALLSFFQQFFCFLF